MLKKHLPKNTKQRMYFSSSHGLGNSSEKFNFPTIKNLIEQQRIYFSRSQYRCHFNSCSNGVGEGFTVQYHADKEGIQVNYEAIKKGTPVL